MRLTQVYLDGDLDTWLRREVRIEALTRGADVTASAVVRLALRRLREQVGTAGVVEELSRPLVGPRSPGRPRR